MLALPVCSTAIVGRSGETGARFGTPEEGATGRPPEPLSPARTPATRICETGCARKVGTVGMRGWRIILRLTPPGIGAEAPGAFSLSMAEMPEPGEPAGLGSELNPTSAGMPPP